MGDEEIQQKVLERLQAAKKRQKPGDLAKSIGEEMGVSKGDVKNIIKNMAKQGQLIFTYYGSSFIELPGADKPQEEA
ncbi:MAG: hypothetical protein GXP25_05425 [Planctomycetes bacterium]|nr:hypothetical protein [Planctomycetota bacterium]